MTFRDLFMVNTAWKLESKITIYNVNHTQLFLDFGVKPVAKMELLDVIEDSRFANAEVKFVKYNSVGLALGKDA